MRAREVSRSLGVSNEQSILHHLPISQTVHTLSLSLSLSLRPLSDQALSLSLSLSLFIMLCYRSLPFYFLATFLFFFSATLFSLSHGDDPHFPSLQTLPTSGTPLDHSVSVYFLRNNVRLENKSYHIDSVWMEH